MGIPKNRYMEYLKDFLEISSVLLKMLVSFTIVLESIAVLLIQNYRLDLSVADLLIVLGVAFIFKFLADRIN